MFMKFTLLLTLLMMNQSIFAQEIRSIKFNELQNEIKDSGDTLLIYNFWATWCKPCVEELPSFEKAHSEFSNQKVKVVLVNLDFNSKVSSVVDPFIKKKNIQSSVYHITDTDPNEWINKIDPIWSGAIPATVIYLSGEKVFFLEGQISEQSLIWEIEKLLEERTKNKTSE